MVALTPGHSAPDAVSALTSPRAVTAPACLCCPTTLLSNHTLRSRAAKAYIGRLKAAAGSDEDDDDGEGGGGTLSDRLMTEAKEAAGRVQRNVADSVTFADVPALGACSSYGEGRLLRGHRLAATAVCLASDDRTAFTVSKCGGIFQWDVETGVRCGPGPVTRAQEVEMA